MRASDRIDRAALERHLAAAIREAGELALKTFRGPVKSWLKSGNSPVSDADIAVDALLRQRLEAAGLGCGWLSEETEDDPARLTAEHVWIVDPIDGTRAYLAGLPDWTISVALAQAGRPILAAIFAPVSGDLYLASAGGGATCNDRPIRATDGVSLAGARAAGPKRYLDGLTAIEPTLIAEPKVHSLALRLVWVAHGRLDVAFAGTNSHDWDLAAADLLVHEAHGALTTLAGDILIYNRPKPTHPALFAAGRSRHQALDELMRAGQVAFR
ncbi:MAG TPA: 3'(2'),5'-bisphosphate nucleotidase CysQ [Xanthobacteraceae bacterium]